MNKWFYNKYIFVCNKMNLDTDLTAFTMINQDGLKIKCRPIKLIEDNRRKSR